MKLSFEYGLEMMDAVLPDNTDVFIPGETVADPPHIPDDKIYEVTLKALRNPIGMPPLSETAKKGMKVTIIFPDRVKGGERETSHRRVSINLILKELYAAGVEKKDILMICSNGLHNRNNEAELRGILGDELCDEFMPTNQITTHDSEDYDNLVDLGTTERGDAVLMNKAVFDSDIAILIGHVLGNPYGGYSGGYKHCATGITHWKSIATHHNPEVMHRGDFTPVSGHSLMRTKFDEIGMYMEKCMGKKFFCCDAVLDSTARQLDIFCGYAEEMMPLSWVPADKRTYVKWADKKYDVMVFGAPRFFHYGDGMGYNPIMLMQAISAQVIRHKRIMSEKCVIICASECNGEHNEELWPYTEEMYNLFMKEGNKLTDIDKYSREFAVNQEYIDQYRHGHAFHPFHGFSMISCGHIAEMNAAAIYIVGAKAPGIMRGMGCKTRATIEEALKDAKKIVGDNPNILALPKTFKLASVHLDMKD